MYHGLVSGIRLLTPASKHLLLLCSVAIHVMAECCNRIAIIPFCCCINFLIYKSVGLFIFLSLPYPPLGDWGNKKTPNFILGLRYLVLVNSLFTHQQNLPRKLYNPLAD